MNGIKIDGKLCANSKDVRTDLESIYNIEDLEQKEDLLWWQKRGLSYTSTGYGRKIPTSIMVKIPGLRNIWRRVYCCIYSNVGTCYVTHGRNWIVIR